MFDITVIGLSFIAGLSMFFNPCGVALLPAYVSLLLGKKEKGSQIKRAFNGLKIGIVVSAGILTVFLTAGTLISLFGNFLAPYAFWFGTFTGIALIILGMFMFAGKGLRVRLPHQFQSKGQTVRFYLFGVGYAIGGIGCTLPVFLLVVFTALGSGSFVNGIANFVAFSLGTILLMLGVTTATAISKSFVETWVTSKIRLVYKSTSLIIIGAGGYLIYFNLQAFVL